jgi:hypothetical protein
VDDSFLLLLNPGHEDTKITLPDGPMGKRWQLVFDTDGGFADESPAIVLSAGTQHTLLAHSLAVLCRAS